MNKTIDLYLISGFLGSGKTTFLQRLLEDFQGKKVGVIVNEFGGIGIDGTLLERNGIQLVEINNGSIFCSCLKGGFVKTLIGFSKEAIDVLLIENSGMADPSNIHHLLDELGDRVGRPYYYRGAVCILNAVSFLKYVQVLAPVQNQVATSNFIVINKIDQVNQPTIEEIKQKVLELNPKAFLYETMYSDIPLDILEEKLVDNGYIGETSNQPYNRMTSYSIECEAEIPESAIQSFVREIQPQLLRMKGLVKIPGKWMKVDVVGDSITIQEFIIGKKDIIEHTKLVVIGNGPKEFKRELLAAWEKFCGVPIVIYE